MPIDISPATHANIASPFSPGTRIQILDSDPTQGQTLARSLETEGVTVEVFEWLEDLTRANTTTLPMAIIVDCDLVFNDDPTGRVITELKQRAIQDFKQTLPVIFTSTKSDMQTRLRALRAGSDAYACKPLEPTNLLAKLHELIEVTTAQPYRILLVDDDQDIAELYSRILEAYGFVVKMVTNPFSVIESAFDFHPEAVALDLYLPETSGFEIARIFRQEEQFSYVPIVFISAEEDKQIQTQAINEGAFDFLVKPVSPERMTHILGARARQFRKLNAKLRYLDERFKG